MGLGGKFFFLNLQQTTWRRWPGPEIGLASTEAVLASLTLLYRLGVHSWAGTGSSQSHRFVCLLTSTQYWLRDTPSDPAHHFTVLHVMFQDELVQVPLQYLGGGRGVTERQQAWDAGVFHRNSAVSDPARITILHRFHSKYSINCTNSCRKHKNILLN